MTNKIEGRAGKRLSRFQRERVYSVILSITHKYVDKRARIKGDEIIYSLFNYKTRIATNKVLDKYTIFNIFNELYPSEEPCK